MGWIFTGVSTELFTDLFVHSVLTEVAHRLQRCLDVHHELYCLYNKPASLHNMEVCLYTEAAGVFYYFAIRPSYVS